ncbi:division/cell wall cluster transcriptional repressor MraZ [Mycoplasmopsis gallinarum]
MWMFGLYEKNLDSKNRIIVPIKFINQLGTKFFLTLGMNGILELRSQEEFAKLTNDLVKRSNYDQKARLLKRFWLGNSYEVELDALNRFTFPKLLVEKAAIQKNVVLVGLGDLVEIWSAEKYYQYNQDLSNDEIQEAMESLLKDATEK